MNTRESAAASGPRMGLLARWALALTSWTERWVPDSWVIAVVLTLVVAVMAMTVGGASPAEALDGWGRGFWALLTFAMQLTLMMVASYACAVSPPMKRLLTWLATRPNPEKPRQAILLMAVFSTVTAYLNWAFSLASAVAFLPFVVRANPRVDYRMLVVCAYLGLGTVWHVGPAGTAPLVIATPDNFLLTSGVLSELIATSRTIFSPFNLLYALAAGAVGVVVALAIAPPNDRTVTITDEELAHLADSDEKREEPRMMRPAERIDWWPGWSIISAGAMIVYFGMYVRTVGFSRAWSLDSYNLIILAIALLLHWHPKSFLQACEQGIRNTWGIVIQFPMYAGIFGLVSYTQLGTVVSDFFVNVSTPRMFPMVVYVYSGIMNYFIPSGGSKWIVEAPFLIPAGEALGLSVSTITLSYAYGDMTTNLIQPFWAIPILSATGLRFGDIMGYCVILAAGMAIFNGVVMLLIPLQL